MKITKRQLKGLIKEACGDISLEKPEIYGHGGKARMAKSQLFQIATDAAELHDMLNEEDELPEWVQSKIAVMAHSMDAVFDHLEYKYRSHLGGEEIDMDDFVAVQVAEGSDWVTDRDETMADMKFRMDEEDDEYWEGYQDALDGKGIDIGASPMYQAGFDAGFEELPEDRQEYRVYAPPVKISGMGRRQK